MRLSRTEVDNLITANPLEVGQTIRINHNTSYCSGSSPSLKLERPTSTTTKLKCFRCGAYGIHNTGHYEAPSKYLEPSRLPVTLPKDSDNNKNNWPPQAKVWVNKAQLTDEEIDKLGLTYSKSMRRILAPLYADHRLDGYIARKLFDDDPAPKYFVKTKARQPKAQHFKCGGNTVVLVEDVLSGVKVSRHASCISLLGTNFSDTTLEMMLAGGYSKAVIWLDDDNALVQAKQRALKNKLELYMDVQLVKGLGKDPKECDDAEIKSVIGE